MASIALAQVWSVSESTISWGWRLFIKASSLSVSLLYCNTSVSYTHLDVYKRQFGYFVTYFKRTFVDAGTYVSIAVGGIGAKFHPHFFQRFCYNSLYSTPPARVDGRYGLVHRIINQNWGTVGHRHRQ